MSKHKLEFVLEDALREATDPKDIRPGERPSDWIRRLQERPHE